MQVACLIATKNRADLLLNRALASVVNQTSLPDCIVIVNDGEGLSEADVNHLQHQARACAVPLILLDNVRRAGCGGAWNTGLQYLRSHAFSGFVALLDDDDSWLPEHLEANAVAGADANVVVSGLQLIRDESVIERPLIAALHAQDFLRGNPGWQGSNTFVELRLLCDSGGFREGLPSLNDRDLAYRLLRNRDCRPALTHRWTARWHCDTPQNLSSPYSPAKLGGLRAFYRLYGAEMTGADERCFFTRARELFGFERSQIDRPSSDELPELGFQRQDANE